MTEKIAIHTDKAPPSAATYSQAVRKGPLLQVAGQGGFDPATNELAGPTIAEQTRQTLRNIRSILEAAGASMDDVVMLRVYLTDLGDFAAMNEVYAEFVAEPYPARTTVRADLLAGMLIEIDALAVP